MSDYDFLVYIDEAGDTGLRKVTSSTNSGSGCRFGPTRGSDPPTASQRHLVRPNGLKRGGINRATALHSAEQKRNMAQVESTRRVV